MTQFAKISMPFKAFNQASFLIDTIRRELGDCVTEITLQEICGASCIFVTFSKENIYLKLHVYPESWSISRHYTTDLAKVQTLSSKDFPDSDCSYDIFLPFSEWLKTTA